MALIGVFPRGSPAYPCPFIPTPLHTHSTVIGSRDLDAGGIEGWKVVASFSTQDRHTTFFPRSALDEIRAKAISDKNTQDSLNRTSEKLLPTADHSHPAAYEKVPSTEQPQQYLDSSRYKQNRNKQTEQKYDYYRLFTIWVSSPRCLIRGLCTCASKVKKRVSDTGDTNTHAQRLIAPTRNACSVSVLTLHCLDLCVFTIVGKARNTIPFSKIAVHSVRRAARQDEEENWIVSNPKLLVGRENRLYNDPSHPSVSQVTNSQSEVAINFTRPSVQVLELPRAAYIWVARRADECRVADLCRRSDRDVGWTLARAESRGGSQKTADNPQGLIVGGRGATIAGEFHGYTTNHDYRGRSSVVVRIFASRQGETGSIPRWVAPGFPHEGSAGFLEGFPFPPVFAFWHCSILTSFHPTSALKTSIVPKYESLRVGWTPRGAPVSKVKKRERAIRATQTRNSRASSLLRARRAVFPSDPIGHQKNSRNAPRRVVQSRPNRIARTFLPYDTKFHLSGVTNLRWHFSPAGPDEILCSVIFYFVRRAVVAERLACLPPTRANRVQSPAGSLPDFRKWESRRRMPLVGGFSRGSPVSSRPFNPALLHSQLPSPSSAL
ncbi:hypothetical protein PR048_033562 [Dryococelus australis]|uniref:Uncharacterized protein n=1 Tax=Dryococelus australis TaxID=614101 RepID=A0ABQ9G3V9_9NEOP|nr:hypothetical protein PR048_033562 [Dryococelus australis]